MSRLLKSFLGFCSIGAVMTFLSLVLIAVTNEILTWDPLVSYVFAYTTTLLLSYFLNSKYVFHSSLNPLKMISYCATYISGMLLGMLLIKLGIALLPQVNETLISYAVIPITLVWNFVFVNKILTMKKEKR